MKKLMFAISLMLVASALIFQGCGIKAPPKPPPASAGLSQSNATPGNAV